MSSLHECNCTRLIFLHHIYTCKQNFWSSSAYRTNWSLFQTWLKACLTNMKAKDQFHKHRVLSDGSSPIRHKNQKKSWHSHFSQTSWINRTFTIMYCREENTLEDKQHNNIITLQAFAGLSNLSCMVCFAYTRAVKKSRLLLSWTKSSTILSRRNIRFCN